MDQFREACGHRNVQRMMDLYPTLRETGTLTPEDTFILTQALHAYARNPRRGTSQTDIIPLIQQVIGDLQRGAIEPHHLASVHLLGICRHCRRFDEGHDFWQWLIEQDERFVSSHVYGAAIELMATGGMMTLPELEDLYTDALKRFPGTFAEYHLSPDAIVPDRTQPNKVPGIPTTLLQGILTARILARDWKKAYLALDTVLRLYPTQTGNRFFELFITERPITEAYAAYTLACRAGVRLGPTHLTTLITKITSAMEETSMPDRMMLVRAVANALYAYVETGAELQSIHVAAFIRTLEQVLPEKNVGEDFLGEESGCRNAIVLAAYGIVSGLLQAGMPPQLPLFASLISLAGNMRAPELLVTTLQDLEAAKINLGPIEVRRIITSAGLVGNREVLEHMWERVVSAAEIEGAAISYEDWITLTKACRRASHTDFFFRQLSRLPHAITSRIQNQVLQQIEWAESTSSDASTFQCMSLDRLNSSLDALRVQVQNIEAVTMSGQTLNFMKTPFYMHIDPEQDAIATPEALRTVYDEMTTDPHQPAPLPPADGKRVEAVLSSTGIPLDELRFLNWVTVLEMMALAECHEINSQKNLNKATPSYASLKRTPNLFRIDRAIAKWGFESPGELRLRIKALRTPISREEPKPLIRKLLN